MKKTFSKFRIAETFLDFTQSTSVSSLTKMLLKFGNRCRTKYPHIFITPDLNKFPQFLIETDPIPLFIGLRLNQNLVKFLAQALKMENFEFRIRNT